MLPRLSFLRPRNALLSFAFLCAGVSMVPAPVHGTELNELQEGLPLAIDDAIPLKPGEAEFHGVLRYQRLPPGGPGEGRNEVELRPHVEVGAARNLQFSLDAPYRVGNAPETSQGDLRFEGMYQLVEEHGGMPAFSLAAGVERLYGADSGGTEVTLKGLMTKSLGSADESSLAPKVNFNLALHHNLHPDAGERNDRYIVGAAYSKPVNERALWAAGLTREQERQRGQAMNMAELGMRWMISREAALATALGRGLNQDAPRWRFLVGVQTSLR